MGSSDSRPQPTQQRHFTAVNARLLADQTTNPTHPRPTSTTNVASNTATRAPNYIYQVPRDEDIKLPLGARANSSAAAAGSTIRTSSSSTMSNPSSNPVTNNARATASATIRTSSSTTMSTPSSNSVTNNASATAARPANSSKQTAAEGYKPAFMYACKPSTTSSVSTTRPHGSTAISSYNSSSVSNSSTISVPKTANSSMPSTTSSITTTRPPGSTATSCYNRSRRGNSPTIPVLKLANSTMPSTTSSVTTARPPGSTATSSYNRSTRGNSPTIPVLKLANSTMPSTTSSITTTRPPGSSATSSYNMMTLGSTITAPKPANSTMPSTTSSFTTTRPPGSTATSSYNSSTLGNSSVSRNENSSVNSVSNPKPLVSTASSSNTSNMNSKFENLNLYNANSTINTSTYWGSNSSQHEMNVNKRNSESNENLSCGNQGSSEHKRNAFRRRRNNNNNNNAGGVTQPGPHSQFNNRSHSGNRQPRGDRNHRPRNIYPSNFEETRGNRTNRPNDSGNRQHPRNRNPRNVFSDDRATENSGDDRTKEVHDAFMKKLIGTYPPNYDKFRGLFCAACNHYEVFIGRRPNVKHIDTAKHTLNISNNPRIKSLSCSSCKIMLHCDIQFLVAHKQSKIHMFIADQKPRSAEVCAEPSKQVDKVVKGDNTLELKEDIKNKFLQRLDMSSEINDYSFYCHVCEQWFTSHEVWDTHLKSQHDGNDTKLMNMTFKHCQQCKLMMCGSRLLSIFHADDAEHEKFRTYLNIPSAESSDDDDEDEDASDDVSTTSSAAAREQKPVYLVLKNLPPTATKRDIFAYFKDFGHLENWIMNPIGENTAVVQFRFRFRRGVRHPQTDSVSPNTTAKCTSQILSVAENIINSRFPLEIHGSRFDACLQYL